ncbi:alpha/beta hydrolase [Nocardia donostiensis]|uniref:Esterase n=1 Tax=Nocardia donostiensis TaxID=1538463 RepID=A0A1W0B3H1_9NOCA|nr:alpha/beta hydrolase [Nocardia donostiensis]ONM50689.1 esterase [Nocardia donostiensis]OQS17083.1 esterase [Nocardia donostiensis]OQS18911.1 esterase [Nocardia donostiensis]
MRDIAIPLPIARALLNPFYRVGLNERLPWRAQRALLDIGSRLQPVPSGTVVHRLRLGGRPAERHGTAASDSSAAVLYLHGGGYAVGSTATHRSLTARLAHQTGVPVYSLDYRLAPEHPFPAALDDAEAAFVELVDGLGLSPSRIAIAGDSAGGGLSLATAQRLIARHGYTPAALGLIAPWADPNQIPDRHRDLVISKPWSRACAEAYLGGGDNTDPGYAPLRGMLHGLPPTYVQVDTGELLHSQCIELAAALRAAGVTVAFTESSGLWHVAQLQAALVGSASSILRELADFLCEAISGEAIPEAHLRDLG